MYRGDGVVRTPAAGFRGRMVLSATPLAGIERARREVILLAVAVCCDLAHQAGDLAALAPEVKLPGERFHAAVFCAAHSSALRVVIAGPAIAPCILRLLRSGTIANAFAELRDVLAPCCRMCR